MAERLRFLESFEEGVLGGLIHSVGRGNDEEAVASLDTTGESEEVADLLDGDDGGSLAFVGAERDRILEGERSVGRHDKNTTADLGSDFINIGGLLEKHIYLVLLHNGMELGRLGSGESHALIPC